MIIALNYHPVSRQSLLPLAIISVKLRINQHHKPLLSWIIWRVLNNRHSLNVYGASSLDGINRLISQGHSLQLHHIVILYRYQSNTDTETWNCQRMSAHVVTNRVMLRSLDEYKRSRVKQCCITWENALKTLVEVLRTGCARSPRIQITLKFHYCKMK